MWKYIVYWVLSVTVNVDCPPEPVVKDEFGRQIYQEPDLVLRICTTSRTDTSYKVFYKKDSALMLYKKGINEMNNGAPVRPDYLSFQTDPIIAIWIDSVKIKP